MKIDIKSWKFWTILAGVICGIVAIIFIFILIFGSSTKLNCPKNINIFTSNPQSVEASQASNIKTFVTCDAVGNATKYEFWIKIDEKNYYSCSQKPSIEITQYLTVGGEFTIMCKAIGGNGFEDSEYSLPVKAVNKIKLQTPSINIDGTTLKVNFQQTFNETVPLKFIINYRVNETSESNLFLTIEKEITSQTAQITDGQIYAEYNLQTLLDAGEYYITVQIASTNSSYLESGLSNGVGVVIT